MWDFLCTFHVTAKVNNHTLGETSPNLVTLTG
jgi:hypothetical protein